ncbi:MAG: ATP-binding protein [Bacillota bacterium]|nr:ATP-binding protein [Bacillota bacterium]
MLRTLDTFELENLVSKWVQFFGDPMLIAALVDRVTHRAHILNMNGEQRKQDTTSQGGSVLNSQVDHS